MIQNTMMESSNTHEKFPKKVADDGTYREPREIRNEDELLTTRDK